MRLKMDHGKTLEVKSSAAKKASGLSDDCKGPGLSICIELHTGESYTVELNAMERRALKAAL